MVNGCRCSPWTRLFVCGRLICGSPRVDVRFDEWMSPRIDVRFDVRIDVPFDAPFDVRRKWTVWK